MLNFEERIEKVRTEAEQTIRTLEILRNFEESIDIGHVFDNKVVFPRRNYLRNVDILHELKDKIGNYKLSSYYMVSNELCLKYYFKNYDIYALLYCIDPEYALSKVSGGRCKVVNKKVEQKKVICEVEDGKE